MKKIENISVMMPTYNAMPLVKDAVESILSQTFKDFEFIVINRLSTDGTDEYLDSITDPRVRVIHTDQPGIELALNKAIEESKYRWIARMDADDVALPERLERQIEFQSQNPQYALISTGFGYVGKNGKPLKATQQHMLTDPPLYRPMVDPMILEQGMLFDKEAIMSIGGYRTDSEGSRSLAEGMDLCMRLEEAGFLMTSMPDILMRLRILADGISAPNFVTQRVTWKYVRACAAARRANQPEPKRDEFFKENWPKGCKRLRVEGARQFRLAGAAWSMGKYFSAAARLFLSVILRPDHVISKFRIYFSVKD